MADFFQGLGGGEDQRLGDPHVLGQDARRVEREQLRDIVRAGRMGHQAPFLNCD